ncbi:MAG: DUF4177 domain-containing protein [bacterium]|nr:DUF4177 domain-containing protein [bacterium]
MAYEYKILEPMDYGHPGAGARYQDFQSELSELSDEGWELVQLVPSMMRGRKVPGGREDNISMTTVAMVAVLRRKIE